MIIESITVIGFAILIDLIFGDPKNRYHPTAWIGTFIAKLTTITKNQNPTVEKIGGIIMIIIICSVAVSLLSGLNFGISLISVDYVSLILSIVSFSNSEIFFNSLGFIIYLASLEFDNSIRISLILI